MSKLKQVPDPMAQLKESGKAFYAPTTSPVRGDPIPQAFSRIRQPVRQSALDNARAAGMLPANPYALTTKVSRRAPPPPFESKGERFLHTTRPDHAPLDADWVGEGADPRLSDPDAAKRMAELREERGEMSRAMNEGWNPADEDWHAHRAADGGDDEV